MAERATSEGGPEGWRVYLLWRLMAAGLSILPEFLAALIAYVVSMVLYLRGGKTKAMHKRHLSRVLAYSHPGSTHDDAALERLAKRSYQSYARYWVDGARIASTSARTIRRRMWLSSNYHALTAALDEGRGVVLALPHVGSWEWGGAFLALEGYPMTTVAERIESKRLFQWFARKREKMGLLMLPLGTSSGIAILRVLRAGGLVGLLCDRDIEGNGVEVEFFGERTTLPAGPAALALRTNAALFVGVVYAGSQGMHIGEISDEVRIESSGTRKRDMARITQEIAHRLERLIAHAPTQWHLFQPNWPSDRAL